jgi:hypothetical protein
VLAGRSRELGQVIADAEADAHALKPQRDSLLARILAFFGLAEEAARRDRSALAASRTGP